jgi:2',3'-cyclic-nucleotide 2'-phosphodiesterase (5'-nucleotidase family)
VVLRILHTNDFHGTLDDAREAFLKTLRKDSDLYFDTGDVVRSGNLAIPMRPEPAWPRLAKLDCTASVPGNRESHPLEAGFKAKLAGRTHPMICANLIAKSGNAPLPSSLIVSVRGIRIGLVGVMVAIVTKGMATQGASAYLWDPPISSAVQHGESLRGQVDALFALTHIGFTQDQKLAETGVFDAVFGGHSHTVLDQPVKVGRTWIAQGGSHGRFVGQYEWDERGLHGGLVPLI